jgi:anti-anti-sigma factor
MTSTMCDTNPPVPVLVEWNPSVGSTEMSGLTELVRGHDQELLDRLAPLARRQSLILDLRSVERIDAAGIAALISLYRSACEAGHCFTVTNVSPRVAEILIMVGLDQILLSQNAVHDSHCGPEMRRTAA